MPSPSAVSVAILLTCLIIAIVPAIAALPQPIAILTQASGAYLDEQAASPGLSVFEGERLQTDPGGRAFLHLGNSSMAFIGNSDAALLRITGGIHVDLSSGTLRFTSNESRVVEVHAEDATIRSQSGQATDATISIVQPKVLQVDARRGSLDFSYREEFRSLPQGQIYRIYLDSPEQTQTAGGASAGGKAGTKVAYYILGAGAAGVIAWLTYEAVHSGNQAISPARP